MKKLSTILLSALVLIACKNEPEIKDYVTLSGKIENKKDSLLLINSQQFRKTIKVNEDGTFKDTMKIDENFYLLANGPVRTVAKLKNGYDLKVNFDADDVIESLTYSGLGEDVNNYIADKMRLQKEFKLDNVQSYFELEKPEFDKKVEALKTAMAGLMDRATELDSSFTSTELKTNEQFLEYLTSNYEVQHKMFAPVAKGKPSPTFNFPDINGNYISLADLKGNYVYIDVWATWCTPCLREIPYLKELEKQYHDKNIKFVSLSIDKQQVKDKWKQMVIEKELSGIQIMEDKNGESEFVKAYNINSIPRFIFLDSDGNIISNNAPRPSDPELKSLFNEYKL